MKVATTHLSWSFGSTGMTNCARITGHKRASKVGPIYLYDVSVMRSSDKSYEAEMIIACCSLPIYNKVNTDAYGRVHWLLKKFFMSNSEEHHLLEINSLSVQEYNPSSFSIKFEPRRNVEFTHSAVKLFLAVLDVLKVTDLPHGKIPYPHVYLETSIKTRDGKLVPFGEALVEKFYPTRVLA
jgi:hypothetical protein